MVPPGFFRRKEKEKKEAAASQQAPKTLLEELCKDDKELLEVMSRTILLNPETTLKEGIDFYVDKAQEHEKSGDLVKARIAYQVAGEISQYEGKLVQTQKFFKKAAEVDPNYVNRQVFEYYAKKENADRALAVAQEYYTKTRKSPEK